MARKEKEQYLIQSVSRALDLLEQYEGDICELKLTELSRRLSTNKNYVLRLLATLESRGFVVRSRYSGAYHLGHAPLKLSESWIRSKRLAQEGHHVLEQVSRLCSETVYLAAFRERGVMCVDSIESTFPVRVDSQVYTSLPLHCTAPGKILLAHAGSSECLTFLQKKGLEKFTEQTIVSSSELLQQLQVIREQGNAVDREEFEPGLCGVAAPVRNYASRVIGVVGLVGPSFRLVSERLHGDLAELVVGAARETSLRLGYQESAVNC